MLGTGLFLIVISGVLYIVWNISDAVDEVSGKKRRRQIEKLQKASMAIGATSVVASTTQMFKDSEEDEEIANIIQNAHNTQTSEVVPTVDQVTSDLEDDATGVILDEESREDFSASVNPSSVGVTKKVVILEELSNMEVKRLDV
jgi:hypothetical protein